MIAGHDDDATGSDGEAGDRASLSRDKTGMWGRNYPRTVSRGVREDGG